MASCNKKFSSQFAHGHLRGFDLQLNKFKDELYLQVHRLILLRSVCFPAFRSGKGGRQKQGGKVRVWFLKVFLQPPPGPPSEVFQKRCGQTLILSGCLANKRG